MSLLTHGTMKELKMTSKNKYKLIKETSLQLSFLKASVVDIELVNDFAIAATVFNIAEKYGIKYIE